MQKQTIFPDLNQEQLTAVQHKEGPLLVLAGAGSGKTRIVTYRIASLMANNVEPDSILALTFTNKAAGEMQHRIEKLLKGNERGAPLIATFHSLGAKILRESIQHLGFKKDFVIYDDDDTNKVIRSCLQKLGIKGETATLKSFKRLISFVKNQHASPDEMDLKDAPYDVQSGFKQLYSLYQERLKDANALDFDDLLYLVVRLFREHKEVLEHYQERWQYLLIDEYQDTNHSQYILARLLVEKTLNIFVVGDPDQSIYSWRGANIHNILNFEKDFSGAKVIRLEQNYRSRENILQAANHLIQNNQHRFEKTLWSSRGAGEQIRLFVGMTERDEAEYVSGEIIRLHRQGVPLRDIAIFYRTNFQSRLFEDFLLRNRISYQIIGGLSFYERREIKDLLAFLHMIVSDYDFIAFSRSLFFLKGGVGEATLEKVRTIGSETKLSLIEMCAYIAEGKANLGRLTEKQRKAFEDYHSLILHLRSIAKESELKDVVIETINKTGFLDILREDRDTFEERKSNIEELVTKAYEWESMSEAPSLQAFLEELTLKNAVDDMEEKTDKVNLMTIHNGKGLEFTAVFLVGMEEDLFPHVNSRETNQAVEEERRLCYVGMTRAKERLFFTAAESRFIWGTHRTMRPSRFLREIPRSYITKMLYEESP